MLKPNKEDYVELTNIIEWREKQGYDFNETIGWGHVISSPDYWESFGANGTKWDFYGAFTVSGHDDIMKYCLMCSIQAYCINNHYSKLFHDQKMINRIKDYSTIGQNTSRKKSALYSVIQSKHGKKPITMTTLQ